MTHRDLSFIENPTARDYAVAAEVMLRDGEPGRALELLAAALALDPSSQSLRVLLCAIDDADRTLLFGTGPSQPEFFGLVAAKSWLLAHRGEPARACASLLGVVRFRPEVPYLPWVLEWGAAGADPGSADETRALLVEVSDALARGHTDARRANALALAELLRTWSESCPTDRQLAALLVRHLLSLEQVDGAEAAALRQPLSWHRAVSLARVAMHRGDTRAAIAHYRDAATLDPSEHTALLDAAELEQELGELQLAIDCYAQALAREPRSSIARVAWLSARFAATRDPEAFEELIRLEAESAPDEQIRESLAFETWLPLPESPGAHALMALCRRLVKEGAVRQSRGPLSLRVEVSSPEPPSLRLAFHASLEVLGVPEGAELRLVDGAGVVAEAEHPWLTRAAVLPEPRAPGAAEELIQAAKELSRGRYSAADWWSFAKLWRARHPNLDEDAIGPLMLRPPPCPDLTIAPPLFVFRFQVAVAMLWLTAPSPFLGSRRAALVERLLVAPADWTGVAVALALSCVALEDPSARPSIEAWFAAAVDPERTPPDWFVAMVARVWQRLPDLAPSRVAQLKSWARLG